MTTRKTMLGAAFAAAAGVVCCLGASAFAQKSERGGTLVSAAANLITISSGDKIVLLKFKPEQNVVVVKGKLAPEQLKAGMIVRFTGALKGTKLDGEISDVKVFTAADGYQLGILQDAPDQPATVTGTLQSFKNSILTVSAGRKRFTGKLAEGAAIEIETRDFSLAKRGNAVSFEGRAAPNNPTTINAKKIIITLGESASEAGESEPAGKKAKKKN